MGYVCLDLVAGLELPDRRAARVATRLGYTYLGLLTNSTFITPAALLHQVLDYEIELLIVPDFDHLRGHVPPELADLTDIHELTTGRTFERGGGYAPEGGPRNPLHGDRHRSA